MSGDFTFLKGNIETIILCALYNKDMYGYELAKNIKERSGGKYEIKQPTLYSYLKRLEQDGYVYAYWGGESSGGRRRYYKLTEKGRQDCEKFLAEWEYQRDVMGSLVDGTADVESISQEDATKLFGRKTARKKKVKTLDEQDEIARRLNQIAPIEETPEEVDAPTTTTVASVTGATTTTQTSEQVVESVIETPQATTPSANFDVNQDDADVFIENFDSLALQASQKQGTAQTEAPKGENYQHTLLTIIGDQLDEAGQQNLESKTTVTTIDSSAELEEVADSLAREGIRLRIYNHATANFKSKTLIPHTKVICQTAWLTYGVVAILLGLLTLTSISCGNWLPPLITLAVLLVLPIATTINALTNQTRIEKPQFKFKPMITGAGILAGIVVCISLAFSLFNHIELSNFAEVTNNILIPAFVVATLPAFVLIYNYFYKKY